MKWIAYNDSVHGPFPDEAAARAFAREQGYRFYQLADSQVDAWALVMEESDQLVSVY